MTDKEYLKKMIALTEELNRVASAEPYDPDAYNRVIDQLNNVKPPWESRRRRRPWFAFASCIILLIILVWIVYTVLSLLYTRGPQ